MRALQQFWSQSTASKVMVLATAGVIVLIGTFSVLLIASSLQSGNTRTVSQPTSSALAGKSTATATHGSAASPASTSAGTAAPAPGGPPQVGAPPADFIAAYGQPTQQESIGATNDFWANKQQTVLIGVVFTNGLATHITVVGPPFLTSSQTYNSCAVFLPHDAASYNTAPPNTYFHSTVGNLVLENDDSGLCKIYMTP
jgi:hypothetical protein